MLHWYWLIKSWKTAEQPKVESRSYGFVAWGGPKFSEVTPRSIRAKLFWLGLVEMTPVMIAGGAGFSFEAVVPYGATLTVGLAFSVLMCWLLRHQTPPTVIHSVPNSDRHSGGSDAERAAS